MDDPAPPSPDEYVTVDIKEEARRKLEAWGRACQQRIADKHGVPVEAVWAITAMMNRQRLERQSAAAREWHRSEDQKSNVPIAPTPPQAPSPAPGVKS